MPGAREERHRFELDGGTVALDFVNTVSGMRGGSDPRDRLAGYPDVVYWAEQVGLIESHRAAELYPLAEHEPERAAAAFREAVRRIWVSKRSSLLAVAMICVSLMIVGGFLLSLVWAACVGSFLSLVEMIVRSVVQNCARPRGQDSASFSIQGFISLLTCTEK